MKDLIYREKILNKIMELWNPAEIANNPVVQELLRWVKEETGQIPLFIGHCEDCEFCEEDEETGELYCWLNDYEIRHGLDSCPNGRFKE